VFKQELRDFLLESISEKDLEQWFDPLDFDPLIMEQTNNYSVLVLFPHQLFFEWFNLHFKKIFEEKIKNFNKLNIIPIYNVKVSEQNNISKINTTDLRTNFAAEQKTKPQNICSNNYSFENFIFNKKNQFPIAAAKSFAKRESPSPFTIHASTGCGKTHILHSIYKELKNFVPEKYIFFGKLTELETIINNNQKHANPFYIPFIDIKVFIIDNFQECAGKTNLQNSFITLTEFCLEHNIPMAIAIDLSPGHWGFMSTKLRSILESGLVIEIKKPDLEVKTNYIQEQNNLLDLKLNKSNILNIARIFREIRQIQGTILKILAFKTHNGKDSEFNLEKILKHSSMVSSNDLTPELIIEYVAKQVGVNPEDIKSKKRAKEIILARHISMYLLRDIMALNLNNIGKFMDRDHSSVLYSIHKIKELIMTNKETNNYVTNIKNLCLTNSKDSAHVT
jgi:chromosomal replication initiator protein